MSTVNEFAEHLKETAHLSDHTRFVMMWSRAEQEERELAASQKEVERLTLERDLAVGLLNKALAAPTAWQDEIKPDRIIQSSLVSPTVALDIKGAATMEIPSVTAAYLSTKEHKDK